MVVIFEKMDCNPLFSYLKFIVKWMLGYLVKLFIVNEIHLNMGFRCILFICSIKYTEIEKKISKFVLFLKYFC